MSWVLKNILKNSPTVVWREMWCMGRDEKQKKMGGNWEKAENVQTFENPQLKRIEYKPDSKRKSSAELWLALHKAESLASCLISVKV